MKLRKVLAVTLVAAMTMSMAACGGSNNTAGNGGTTDNSAAEYQYSDFQKKYE